MEPGQQESEQPQPQEPDILDDGIAEAVEDEEPEEEESPEEPQPPQPETKTEETATGEEGKAETSEVSQPQPEIDLSEYVPRKSFQKMQSKLDRNMKIIRTEARLAAKALRSRQAKDPLAEDYSTLTTEEKEYNDFLDRTDKDEEAYLKKAAEEEFKEEFEATASSIGRMIELSKADLGTADENPILKAAVVMMQAGRFADAKELVAAEISRTGKAVPAPPKASSPEPPKNKASEQGVDVVDDVAPRGNVLNEKEFMDAVAGGKDMSANDWERLDKILAKGV